MTTTATAPTSTLTGIWTLDPVHSSIGFSVRHTGILTVRGSFGDYDAQLEGSGEDLRLTGTAKVASIETRDENLHGHLQSPDFFDAERHPELRFESVSIQQAGDEAVFEGELTIKGATHPVTLRGSIEGPATDAYGQERLGLQVSGTIDRTLFGLKWNAPLPGGGWVLSNEVRLTADLALIKKG